MADQNESIGAFNIGADREAVNLLKEMSDSLQTLVDYMSKAGEYAGKSAEAMNTMNITQQQMIVNVMVYGDVVHQVQNNFVKMEENNTRILNIQKQSSKELKDQEETGDRIKDKDKDRFEQIGGLIKSTMNDPIEAMANKSKEALQSVTLFGVDVGKMIAGALTVAAMAAEAGITLERYNERFSRTAGLGPLEAMGGGFGGFGRTVELNAEVEKSKLMQYAGRPESMAAAGTLVGLGGFRGEELLTAFKGLAEYAHEAGLNLQKTSEVMAHLHRVTGDSADELRTSMTKVTDLAIKQSFPVQSYMDAVTDLTLATHKYGGSLKGSNSILENNYKMILNGTMTTQEFLGNFQSMSEMLQEHGNKNGTVFTDTDKIIQAFGDDVGKLKVKWGDVLALTEAMTNQFRMSGDEAAALGKFLIGVHDQPGMTATTKQLMGWQETIATGLVDMFEKPKDAATIAAIATGGLAKQFEQGTITTADFVSVFRTQVDTLGDSGIAATDKFKKLANVLETTNIHMGELSQFVNANAQIFRQYGVDEMGEGLSLFKSFNQYMREGSVSVQDFQALLKGPAGASEGARALTFEALSNMGGPVGEGFKKAGTLGSIDVLMPAIQRLSAAQQPGGKAYEGMEQEAEVVSKTFGTRNFSDLNKLVSEAFEKTVSKTFGQFGNGPEGLAIQGRLLSQFLPGASSVYTAGTQAVTSTLEGGALPAAHMQNFGLSVGTFSEAVGEFKQVVSSLTSAHTAASHNAKHLSASDFKPAHSAHKSPALSAWAAKGSRGSLKPTFHISTPEEFHFDIPPQPR